ncbi:hypothetical protein MJG53_005687 [Ovis ammon polii x Ovis aries]|uniref:Uncharacterized protein n=1 Tax=Ovis ammon polii x Ovis aries TaxID=2918886 RepID=A0ACB9V6J4_9CETA|nr:hypothetical protein MJG53_005687 [Ovis ammon polii x Ovis aries]
MEETPPDVKGHVRIRGRGIVVQAEEQGTQTSSTGGDSIFGGCSSFSFDSAAFTVHLLGTRFWALCWRSITGQNRNGVCFMKSRVDRKDSNYSYPHSDLDPHGGEHAQLFFSGCGFWPEQIYASFAIAFCRDVHLHIDDLCLRSSEMPNDANLETCTLTYRKAYTRDPEQAHFADDVMKNYSGSLGLARDRLNGYSD